MQRPMDLAIPVLGTSRKISGVNLAGRGLGFMMISILSGSPLQDPSFSYSSILDDGYCIYS